MKPKFSWAKDWRPTRIAEDFSWVEFNTLKRARLTGTTYVLRIKIPKVMRQALELAYDKGTMNVQDRIRKALNFVGKG